MSDEEAHSEDDGFMYKNRKGLCFCSPHRRDVCHECCVDHRPTNDIWRGMDPDEAMARNEAVQKEELRAMAQAHGGPELFLGAPGMQELYERVAAPPPAGQLLAQRVCAKCARRGDSLKLCSRCRSTWYCSKECQKADFPGHRAACKAMAVTSVAEAGGPAPAGGSSSGSGSGRGRGGGGGAGSSSGTAAPAAPGGSAGSGGAPGSSSSSSSSSSIVGWRDLERRGWGVPARGKVLEVRIMTQPVPFLRHTCSGKDKHGDIRTLAFYLDHGTAPPCGLRQGAVLRWTNPHIHHFVDGQVGARIEDEDLADITVSAS